MAHAGIRTASRLYGACTFWSCPCKVHLDTLLRSARVCVVPLQEDQLHTCLQASRGIRAHLTFLRQGASALLESTLADLPGPRLATERAHTIRPPHPPSQAPDSAASEIGPSLAPSQSLPAANAAARVMAPM